MIDVVECQRCGRDCEIEGSYPVFTAHCDACNAEPEGWDPISYAADKLAGELDSTYKFEDDI